MVSMLLCFQDDEEEGGGGKNCYNENSFRGAKTLVKLFPDESFSVCVFTVYVCMWVGELVWVNKPQR